LASSANYQTSESTIPLVIEPGKDGYLWAINGKSWPHADEIRLMPGVRNRLVFDNRSMMGHRFTCTGTPSS
jgi:FtsP/CotA-like multicopper oxidase with cupredoxin domain